MGAMFPGSGWEGLAIGITDYVVDPNSWGSRKLDAIRKRRAETGEGFATATAFVEQDPAFAGTAESRGLLRDGEDPNYEYWYPLIEWGWDRDRCKAEIAAAGLPVPPKSACSRDFLATLSADELSKLPK